MRRCKHCLIEFDISQKPKGWMANHTRWCSSNPKRSQYSAGLEKARSAISSSHNQYSYNAVCSAETKEKIRIAATGRKHTSLTKEKISNKALESAHRRLKKNTIVYKGVLLDSSWELELAKRLDFLGISWIRPSPLKWVDGHGKSHNYFPDFYLPAFDLYLDPKNRFALIVQKEKLVKLKKQYKNIKILTSIEECKNFRLE